MLEEYERATPLTTAELERLLAVDSDARVDREAAARAVRRRVHYGGVAPEARNRVWRLLLGAEAWPACAADTTAAAAVARAAERADTYARLSSQWRSIDEEQAAHHATYRERRHRVEKDVVRTDRALDFFAGGDLESNGRVAALHNVLLTYAFYNFDVGYVQGMNDVAAPILVAADADEADAFATFKAAMSIYAPNFHKDQGGMTLQLSRLREVIEVIDADLALYLAEKDASAMFFCFRWVLCVFKREFVDAAKPATGESAYAAISRLWDTLWANYFVADRYHHFIALAMLEQHKDVIIEASMAWEEIIGYINDQAGQFDVDVVLVRAECYYRLFLQLCKERRVSKDLQEYFLGVIDGEDEA